MKLRAGELNRRISILATSVGVDPQFGGTTSALVNVVTINAKVTFAGAGSIQKHAQVDSITRADFFIRYRKDISPGMLVQYRDRLFVIQNLFEVEFNAFIQLICEARDDKPN